MKIKTFIWILNLSSLIGTFLVYSHLPANIPIHWNLKGEADKFSSKNSVFLLALIPIFMYIMFIFLPKIDPKRDNDIKHDQPYMKMVASFIMVLLSIHWITILSTFHIIQNVSLLFRIIVGILFILIGEYMTKLRMNYFTGIKLPWTLTNENVWRKTHQVGGKGFVLLGMIFIVSSLFHHSLVAYFLISSLFLFVLFIILYSYIVYQKSIK